MANRRWFLFRFPQGAIALTAACAFGSFCSVRASLPAPWTPSSPTAAAKLGGGARESPLRDVRTAQELAATPRRVQPLPTPVEDYQAWVQEWLDLLTLGNKNVSTGC